LDESDNDKQKVTVANLAEALGVSHQMATQRINSLQKLGLVDRIDSEEDARAKVVVLTKLGKYEVLQLRPFSDEVTKAFNDLELELGAPLVELIRKAELSLLQTPLKQRITESKA
jgi:DNA-binding MarR family transcriptional regulator